MKKIILFLLLVNIAISSRSQSLYFPPLIGNTWDTISPSSLGWCQPRIDSLYNYLQATNADAFIILKDGKIVLEKYFGAFTAATTHAWASAGKSLAATLVGIAQKKNFININNSVSSYLGVGWTSAPAFKEASITVKNLITMTSGLNDNPSGGCTNEDTTKACLQYLVDANTRWAYHTGAYKKVQDVVSVGSGMSFNAFTNNYLGSQIGMVGSWVNQVYYSTPRGAARFGLLALNKGIWQNDTIVKDSVYFKNMINTSQGFNQSYGYLWWLNGKPSYMAPGSQTVFTNPFLSNAPADLFCALGKNDQKIYVVPSSKMVVIRMGNSAYGVASAFSPFDNKVWSYISNLDCTSTSINENTINSEIYIYPNPFTTKFNINNIKGDETIILTNTVGQTIYEGKNISEQNFYNLSNGMYFLSVKNDNSNHILKLIKE